MFLNVLEVSTDDARESEVATMAMIGVWNTTLSYSEVPVVTRSVF